MSLFLQNLKSYNHFILLKIIFFGRVFPGEVGFLKMDLPTSLIKCVYVRWSHFLKKNFLLPGFVWFIEIRTDRGLIFCRKKMWSLDQKKIKFVCLVFFLEGGGVTKVLCTWGFKNPQAGAHILVQKTHLFESSNNNNNSINEHILYC